MSYFYFDQMFRTAVSGINGTSVMPTIIQIASAILLATLLFNVYEAFVRGGPRGARVEEVEATDEEPTGLTGFEIR